MTMFSDSKGKKALVIGGGIGDRPGDPQSLLLARAGADMVIGDFFPDNAEKCWLPRSGIPGCPGGVCRR